MGNRVAFQYICWEQEMDAASRRSARLFNVCMYPYIMINMMRYQAKYVSEGHRNPTLKNSRPRPCLVHHLQSWNVGDQERQVSGGAKNARQRKKGDESGKTDVVIRPAIRRRQ
jgi:hypothetical protein